MSQPLLKSENLYALDIETTGLDWFKDRLLGIGVYSPGFNKYFDNLDNFITWNRSHSYPPLFVTHGGSFDINFLYNLGCNLYDQWAYDTRSLASLLIPRPRQAEGQKSVFSLENLGISLLKLPSWKLDRTQMSSYSRDEVAAYCLKDCEVTWRLYEYCKEKLRDIDKRDFISSWLMPATRFCARLEKNGLYVDKKGLESYAHEISSSRIKSLSNLQEKAKQALIYFHENQVKTTLHNYKELYAKALEKAKDKEKCKARYEKLEQTALSKLPPFNWNSPEQLKWLFRDYYGLDIVNKREDKETTNEAMLASLADQNETARILLDYREIEKLVTTCIPALLGNIKEDGLIHAGYHIGGTRTGRLSSSNPNLQQIPKGRLRSYVQALSSNPRRTLVTIDYSQIEVRIIAEISKEKELIHAFKEGIDPYSLIAQKLFRVKCPIHELKQRYPKERDCAKTAGLSILYGTGAAKLQEVIKKSLGLNLTLQECRRYIEDYRNSFSEVKAYKKKLEEKLANGKVVYNLLGRPFSIESNDDLYMKGLNTMVQGSASDLVIFSQTALVIPELEKHKVPFKHRLAVHDEVVIELLEDEAEVVTKEIIVPAMTRGVEERLVLTCPLKVEYNINTCWEKP